jgi:hypothetical protein
MTKAIDKERRSLIVLKSSLNGGQYESAGGYERRSRTRGDEIARAVRL